MLRLLKSLFSGKDRKSPPEVRDVARRVTVLKMIVTFAMVRSRGEVEAAAGAELREAARRLGLWQSFSPWEKKFVTDTRAASDSQNFVNGSWRLEGMGVLLWALKRIPWLPAHDEQFTHDTAFKIPEQVGEFIASAALRPLTELEKARDAAELWHWRSRTRQLIESNEPFPEIPSQPGGPQFKSYDDVVRFTAKAGIENGTFSEIIAEDFPARGKAYRNLTAEEWSEVSSITTERHFALNWLCGYAPGNRWDETPTGT